MLISHYRWVGALLLLVLGIAPLFLATFTGSPVMLLWRVVFTWAAGGDITILWLTRNVAKDALVMDHAERAGCYLVADGERTERMPSS